VIPLADIKVTVRDFVDRGSIVRKIWGDPDLVLLIFAGSGRTGDDGV
jgi:hypothetical protein